MDVWQINMGRITARGYVDFIMHAAQLFQPVVTAPTICDNLRTRGNHIAYKRNQTLTADIRNALYSHTSKSFGVKNFAGHHNYRFLSSPPPASSTFVFASDKSFVHLDSAAKRLSLRPNHGTTHFMKSTPSGLMAVQAKNTLEPQCASPQLLTRYIPCSLKPQLERFPRAMENCARDN